MADLPKPEKEEGERLIEGAAMLNFDDLCSTVATKNHGKWRLLDNEEGGDEGGVGGVFRMWEGEVFNCLDDRCIAIESLCCPCYRFGKNMKQAGLGSTFIQGSENFLDDCVYHMVCPCCAIAQETRTLEMNNVQGGIWHGRGDTIYITTVGEAGKAFFELSPPAPVLVHFHEDSTMVKDQGDVELNMCA